MLQEKAGEIAGLIWAALEGGKTLSSKDLKKATKLKTEKDLFLGIGWLLREDKLNVSEDEKDTFFTLK
jgi:hypothetical protein